MPENNPLPNNAELDEELRALYEEKGKLPDMSRLEHKRRSRAIRILVALVAFFAILTGASWAGFLFFGAPKSGGGEVRLTFDAAQGAIAGVPQEIAITYENLDRDPLAFATLRLRAPENILFQEIDPAPQNETALEWEFGTLPTKHSGTIRLKVVPYGYADEQLTLQAILSFKPANFNAEFQATQAHTLTIRETALTLSLDGPGKATAGQELEFTARAKNITDVALENIVLGLNPLPDFSLLKADPEARDGIWKIEKLEPGQEYKIRFSGAFASGSKGARTLEVWGEQETPKRNYPLSKAARTVEVEGGAVAVELFVNGEPHLDWVRLGQTLQMVMRLTNKGDAPLENMRALIAAKGDLLNWEQAAAAGGVIENGTIEFPAEGTFALGAGESKEFTATLSVNTGGARNLSPIIELDSQVSVGEVVIRSQSIRIVAASDLTITPEARYFGPDGNPVGAGPLPPKVGEQTRFRIRLKVRNTFHDLSNVKVTSLLPAPARFAENVTTQSGQLKFDEAAREVRWEIPRLPVTTPELTAQFDVAITPTEADRGQLLPLLGISRVEALDTISQVTFSADAASVSSALEADPFGRGKGVVE